MSDPTSKLSASFEEVNSQEIIQLSSFSKALLNTQNLSPAKKSSLDSRIEVSKSISFMAVMYEKLRNALELHEDHLIRRVAIKRIAKRRLGINPSGKGEGENILRELLWSRYVTDGSVGSSEITRVQNIVSTYQYFKSILTPTAPKSSLSLLEQYLYDLMSTEIDEIIDTTFTHRQSGRLYFVYQTLKEKVVIDNISKELADTYFYIACEASFAKNDLATVRAHLFFLKWGYLSENSQEQLKSLANSFVTEIKRLEKTIKNPYQEQLLRFVRANAPPYRILFSLFDKHSTNSANIISNKQLLTDEVFLTCRSKAIETAQKLKGAALRSIVYIFCTKMIFVLLLEFPLTKYIFNEVDFKALTVNTIFPPILMGVILLLISPADKNNPTRIRDRIVEIIDEDTSFETKKSLTATPVIKRPLLNFIFGIVYTVMFAAFFAFIYLFLEILHFNIISKFIFIFFLCVITFFAFRIRTTASEFILKKNENVLNHISDVLFLPFLSIGKILSNELGRFNVLLLVFDIVIETPFKIFIEIIDEWQKFIKSRKDEIV